MLTQFLALQSVKKADAVNIAAAIDTVASQTLSKDWKDKLVALGTDGASVMLGRQNGVVAKLKEGKPFVVAVHCMNHRLKLSFKDATAKKHMPQASCRRAASWPVSVLQEKCFERGQLERRIWNTGLACSFSHPGGWNMLAWPFVESFSALPDSIQAKPITLGRMKKRGRKNFHKLLFLQLNWTSCRGSSLAAWNHHALITFLPANYVCLRLHAKVIMNTIMPNCCCKSN